MDLDKVVTKFLVRCYSLPSGDGQPFTRIVVEHLGSTKAQEVYTRDVAEPFSAPALASEVIEAAREDAEGIGGLQKYSVKAFFGASKKPQVKRIAIDARDELTDDEFSEPASSKGQVAQSMRHTEAAVKLALMGSAQSQSALLQTVNRLQSQVEKLMDERAEYLEKIEELRSQEHERRMEALLIEKQEARKDEAVEQLKLLAPVVAHKLGLPAGLLPGTTAAAGDGAPGGAGAVLSALVQSLKPEQMGRLMAILDAGQQASLMTLISDFQKGK